MTQAEHDLVWFFNSTPGQKSNFGAFVALMQTGGSGGQADPEAWVEDDLLDKVSRHREIQRKLTHLPLEQVRLLKSALTYRQFHPQIANAFGETAGLVVAEHGEPHLLHLIAWGDKRLTELRSKARTTIKQAVKAYAEVTQ